MFTSKIIRLFIIIFSILGNCSYLQYWTGRITSWDTFLILDEFPGIYFIFFHPSGWQLHASMKYFIMLFWVLIASPLVGFPTIHKETEWLLYQHYFENLLDCWQIRMGWLWLTGFSFFSPIFFFLLFETVTYMLQGCNAQIVIDSKDTPWILQGHGFYT